MKITIDFETRSTIDLLKTGAWKYARSPDTEIFCCAVMIDDQEPGIWVNPYFRNIVQAFIGDPLNEILGCEVYDDIGFLLKLDSRAIFEAHNAEFERAIWQHVVMRDCDVGPIPLERWRCSAAKAAAHALPRDLARAAEAMGSEQTKDAEGRRIMLRLSKPKPVNQRKDGMWDEDPIKLVKLFQYCRQDVRTEHEFSGKLRDLNADEQQVWFVDQRINERGVRVDLDSIEHIKTMVASEQIKYEEEAIDICGYGPTKIQEMRAWVEEQGVEIPDMTKSRLINMLEEDDLPDDVRRLFEIRQQAGKTSTAKFDAMVAMACDDGRARGTAMYHAASTGRWGGKGIQLQNMVRGSFKDVELLLGYIREQEYDMVRFMWGQPMTVASYLIRSMMTASPGNMLIQADWSAIEARILAWIADERPILEAFKRGDDIYKIAAQSVFLVPYDKISKDERQVGKVIDLAGGYQGGWSAFKSMAKNYGVQPPGHIVPDKPDDWYAFPQYDKDGGLIEKGKRLSFRDACFKKWASPIVKAWREGRPNTQTLWDTYNKAAILALQNVGKTITAGPVPIKFKVQDDFLFIKLPSGRLLAYREPQLVMAKTPWGAPVEAVSFMGVDSMTKQWRRMTTYGGKLTENIVQAIARDLLARALVKLDSIGFPVIFHVHDEIIGDCDPAEWTLEQLIEVMVNLPAWADGLHVKAEGWTGFRYKK